MRSSRRFAQPRLDRRVRDRPASPPQAARRHLHQRHGGPDGLLEREAVAPGQRVRRWSPSALKVRGSSSTNARPIAMTSAVSTPTSRLPNWLFWTRSRTGWTSGRRPHASRAVTRWIVPRMSAIRTTDRSTRRSLEVRPTESPRPGPTARRRPCAASGAWRPTSRSMTSGTAIETRRSRIWRWRVARFRARRLRCRWSRWACGTS